jgi:hypothetical protein
MDGVNSLLDKLIAHIAVEVERVDHGLGDLLLHGEVGTVACGGPVLGLSVSKIGGAIPGCCLTLEIA